MLYCYENNRLRALKVSAHTALNTQSLENALLVSNRIEEMPSIVSHKNTAILLHAKNRYSLFTFCWFQLKAKTRKEFRFILYCAPKDGLYYALKIASLLSFGYYKLIYFKGVSR